MYSASSGDTPTAAAALNSRDSAFSMPSDHSAAVWERQTLGRDKFDRERYTSTKRDWTVENRSSSYRSSSVLSASGSLSASFNKRRAIGRHETVVENGRYRSAVGRSESSTSLRSPPQIGKGERDVCSPGYGGSPNMERPSKAVDGHHYRDTHLSPGNVRPLSSPRFDSRLHGNQNDSEVLGPWDRERSRFSSPPYTWDAPNRGRDYRERAWSRTDYRRACPLPKLDSSREWSQSDRELLEGRIDRYSSVSGREAGFPDVLSANSREHTRHEWRGRDRILQSGISSQIPAYPPTNSLYNRDSKNASLALEASGAVSPPQHSPMHSSFSHESDQDCGPSTSKKRPRLTWGQGLAKYEKEKTGEDLSAAKKSEEGSNYVGGLHSDGSVASALPEGSLQISNVLPCLEDRHPCEERIRNSDTCTRGGSRAEPFQASFQYSVVYSSEKESTREALAEGNVNDCVNVSNDGESGPPEVTVVETSASQSSVLQYMQAFLHRYQQELPDLSKEILTQHVEKVELEIDRLEKEIVKLDNEHDMHTLFPEKKWDETLPISNLEVSSLNTLVGVLKPPASPLSGHNISPTPVDTSAAKIFLVDAGECGAFDVVVHVPDSLNEHEVMDPVVHQTAEGGMNGTKEQSVIPAALNGFSAAQPRKVKGEGVSAEFEMSRAFEEDLKDSIASIFLSNQEIAEQSSSALAHLNTQDERGLHVERSDCNLQESSVWKHIAERHGRIKSLLELKVTEEKSLRRFAEGVLAVKYRAKREAWKQEQIGNYRSKDRDKCFGTWDPDNATPSRQSPPRICPILTTGSFVPDAHNEEVQVAKNLLVESPVDVKREYMRMPPMILGQKERDFRRFETKNALVEDPVAAEQERKAVNPWSAEEKIIFLDKYSLLGKNLRKIASFLEHKTVADCIQFFYQNQKTEEFEKIHRRHQLKKRRECRASALYLATTTSVSSRHREANAAYVEGLSLVAAAAAAMSVPRDLSRSARSPAMKPCPLGSSSSKTCRDSNLIRQASSTSTLTGKDSNVEHLGGKCAQNTHSRSLKRPPEEVLQWRSQWNDNERDLFMKAVAMFGKDFDSISSYIGTKSLGQCKTYFSKARKRLGLDQLVERHMESRQQDENLPKEMQSKNVELCINGMEVDSDFKMGGDLFEQQLKVERSPLHVNSCMASEVRCNSPHENQEVISALSCPKTLQAADHTGSISLGGNAGQQNVDSSMNQGPCSSFHGRNGTVDVCGNSLKTGVSPLEACQGCTNDSEEALQIKIEPINVKTETLMPSHMSIGVSNRSSSCIHGNCPSTMVSALVPGSLAPTSVVQSPQVKDKIVKATEVKARREPTSWTQEEKEKFVDILKVHGKNWDLLCKSLPAKSLIQIKTYFQNSKAKLGLGSDGVVNNPGRAGSSWKRKVDDSDSSSNAGSAGQMISQKASVSSDDGSLKVSPSILAPSGGSGSNMLSAEALAYANIFGRKLLEDSINAQKVFHAMGLAQNTSSPGILPMLTTPVFSQPNLVSAQQPYMHTASATMKIPQIMNHQQPEQSRSSLMVVEPSSSVGVHQTHLLQPQQQVVGTCQDPTLQSVHKQPPQIDQKTLLQHVPPPNQQQLQQMAEAVLQQLLPHAVQRHQQQLQLAAQQVPHHFQPVLSHHQGQSNWQVSSQASSGTIPVSMVTGQQKQQQSALSQSQLQHHMHGKLQALLQQHQQVPQVNQLQLLQLQRQQQQQQQLLLHLQQAQALSQSQQIQNQTLHMQQSHNLSNEQQQQQSAFFRGFTQLSSVGGEASKQNDFDIQTLGKFQQGASGDVYPPLVLNQTMEAPSKPHVVSEQCLGGDVKLFGQSLLLQPASVNQLLIAKIPSSSSALAASSALPTGIIAGTIASNTPTKISWDHVIQGQGGHQITRPIAFSNGGLNCTVVNGKGDNEMGSVSVQEPVSCSNERFKREARDINNGKAVDINCLSHVSHLPDGNALCSVQTSLDNCTIFNSTSLSCGPSGESLRCENDNEKCKSSQVANLDHGITLNMSRKQELNSVSGSSGGEAVASQGLPRVLDALVALAEWRLQNSSGCSGKLTDEFLSQSWEALQKDPGSLIEAGKASGSLSQLYSEGPQMLQHLRERLLSSHSGLVPVNPGAVGPAPESAVLSNDGQIVLSQAMHPHISVHDPARLDSVIMEADGSGLSNG